MKTIPSRLVVVLLLCSVATAAAQAAEKTRVLVITGGHDYETNQFRQMFRENQDIVLQTAEHPKAHEWFKAENAARYDLLVFYDMWQEISDEAKANLVNRLREGKSLVALHHCLGSYQKWDEYAKIIGGKYHLEKHLENGVEKPGSTYKHDVDFKVRVVDPNHPITRGLQGFAIHDETYGLFAVRPEVHKLLATDEPTSGPTIAWAKEYGKARVVYLQLGHDHLAYENPNYRRLLAQAIRWAARKD